MSNAPEQLDPNEAAAAENAEAANSNEPQLERGTYEIIRNRLKSHAEELRTRLQQLNDERRKVFGRHDGFEVGHRNG